jgi:Ni/Co efflux regulator RcnB
MKKLLLNACALASIAVPGLTLAQGYDDNHVRDQRHDYRQEVRHDIRQNFDRTHIWSPGNRFWWRGRPEFVGYAGPRAGFWFIPGRGYIRPDPRWYGFVWRVGGFVPTIYRTYYVPNPSIYGLAPAPYGLRYVYLGNNVVLMSVHDGRIVQVKANVF